MTSWKIEIPWEKTSAADEIRMGRTFFQGKLGEPVIIKMNGGKLGREVALRRMSEIYKSPFSWMLSVDGQALPESETRKWIGCIPSVPLPSQLAYASFQEVFYFLGKLAKFSDLEFETIEKKMNLMGFGRVWTQNWSQLEYRHQIQLKMAIFSQRYKLIFYFLNERKFSQIESHIPVLEGIRTVCGSFRVSTLILTERAIKGVSHLPFMKEEISIEVSTDPFAEIA